MMIPLPTKKSGDPWSAAEVNQIYRLLQTLARGMEAIPGTSKGPGGVGGLTGTSPLPENGWWGLIQEHDPEPTDNQYWVIPVTWSVVSTGSALAEPEEASAREAVKVTNLGESEDETHELAAGLAVWVYPAVGPTNILQWVINVGQAGAPGVLARIISYASDGEYSVQKQKIDSSGDIVSDGSDPVDAYNLPEVTNGISTAFVDVDEIVVLTTIVDTEGASHYVFERGIYARYKEEET
jgi:hypothetical protein